MKYEVNKKARAFLSFLIKFVLLPAVVVAGALIFRSKNYSYVIFAVTVLSLTLFFCGVDKKRTGTRRLVLSAVAVAAASLGRVLFSFIPGVNPVTAITVLFAIYLGSEAGFMIGAFSALVSNMFAGQGVWTPFQMFAWGMIGMFAGLFSSYFENHTVRLCVYTFFAGIAYSFIMDIWTVLWANNAFSFKMYLASIISAAPYTAIYAVSNVIFTFLLAKPFSEKLGRIKIKYGI
ncbi:MAG: ECF transporter S component [Clostridiales bacterium]|nr:ECF transporter S component [Clostridiales bacterium]